VPKNLEASIHQRLLNQARKSGRPFNELLQYFAIERFLYRLSQSPHQKKFVLKGALMFAVWQAEPARPTMDIDLLGRMENQVETIVAIICDICSQKVEPDGLNFDPESVEGKRIAETAEYQGVRVSFRGSLGNTKIFMQIDVGFGDVIFPRAASVKYPSLLDLPGPRLRGYTRESLIGEKFQAMVKLGSLNSRMKDFFDIWFLSIHFDFDGPKLSMAISKTFKRRKTEVPSSLKDLFKPLMRDPAKATQWLTFVQRNRLQEVPETLGDVLSLMVEFLDPVVRSLKDGVQFDATWQAPGPWWEISPR
jgi:hypothetical protein